MKNDFNQLHYGDESPDKDDLQHYNMLEHGDELDYYLQLERDANKELKTNEGNVKESKRKLKGIRSAKKEIENKAPVYLSIDDLIYIIKYLLDTKSGVKEGFESCEKKFFKCKDWAKKTYRFKAYENYLKKAFDAVKVDKNNMLDLMDNYGLYDLNEIESSATYTSALGKMKKQLTITYQLYDKDCELKLKENIILDKEAEIDILKSKLATSSIVDNKKRAHKLRLIDPNITYVAISKYIGVSRQTVANYFK
jgi:hypothetical protein